MERESLKPKTFTISRYEEQRIMNVNFQEPKCFTMHYHKVILMTQNFFPGSSRLVGKFFLLKGYFTISLCLF